MWPTAHEWLAQRIEAFAKAREGVDSAMESVAEAEMRKLAKRFPTRRLELHSAMGSTALTIHKRNPNALMLFDEYTYTGHELDWHNWPEQLEAPIPELWEAIQIYRDEVSNGIDPSFGTIIYENGKRIAGLAAGGAIRE